MNTNKTINFLFATGVFTSFLGSYFSVSLIGLGTTLALVFGLIFVIKNQKAGLIIVNPLLKPIVFLILAIILSIVLADSYPYQKPLGKIRYLICFFFFCVYFVEFPRSRYVVLKLGVWVSFILALTAVAQHFFGFSPITYFSGTALKPVPGSDFRFLATGFAFHHNPFAATLNFLFPFLFFSFVSREKTERWFFFFSALACGVGVWCSFSRGGWLCFFLSVLIILLVSRPKVLFPALVALGVGGITLVKLYPPFQVRLSSFNLASNLERLKLWKICWQMFKDAPWFGQGFYSFGSRYTRYIDLSQESADFPVEAHNMYLDILSGTGIVGAAAFLFFLWSIGLMLKKTLNKVSHDSFSTALVWAMISAFVVFLVGGIFDKYFYMTQTLVPFLLFLAMACSVGMEPQNQKKKF